MNILVTGAAGLLRGALTQAGHSVIGFINRHANICGNDGKLLGATAFGGSVPQRGTIMALHGDVRQAGLGLDAAIGRG